MIPAMTQGPGQPPNQVQVRFPEDRISGDYANGVAIGVNQHELVVDYLVNVDGPGIPPTVQLVRRMRIPIAMSGDVLAGLANAMDEYEKKFGPVHKPGETGKI